MRLRSYVEPNQKQPQTLQKSLRNFFSRFRTALTELQALSDHDLVGTYEIPLRSSTRPDSSRTGAGYNKLVVVWECDGIPFQIWWEYEYDQAVKTLIMVTYFTNLYQVGNTVGSYNSNLLIGLFQRYNKELHQNKQFFQFSANPLTGSMKIYHKMFVSADQLITEISTPTYVYQVFLIMKTMVGFCRELTSLQLYFQCKITKCPIPTFIQDQISKQTLTPEVFLQALRVSLNEVDTNCQENIQNFGDSENTFQYVAKNSIQFSKEVKNVIESMRGKQKDQKMPEISEILSKIYEVSFIHEATSQVETLVRKIEILSDPEKLQWKTVAKGGFGLIQKAYVDYQLYQFGSKEATRMEGYLVRKSDTKQLKISHEHKIFSLLKHQYHPNIMPHYIPEQKIYQRYIFSKFEPNMSLEKYLKSNKKTMSLQTVIRFMEHTTKGLMFLKDKNIVHLDIKPNNIIITRDLKARISDFGEAFHQEDEVTEHKHGFTVPYVPAEVFYPEPYLNSKVDVYATGVTMYKVLFGTHIWGEIADREKFLADLQETQPSVLLVPERLLRTGIPQIVGTMAKISLKCVSRSQQARPCLFYISVVLSLCRFYIYSLTEKRYDIYA